MKIKQTRGKRMKERREVREILFRSWHLSRDLSERQKGARRERGKVSVLSYFLQTICSEHCVCKGPAIGQYLGQSDWDLSVCKLRGLASPPDESPHGGQGGCSNSRHYRQTWGFLVNKRASSVNQWRNPSQKPSAYFSSILLVRIKSLVRV